MALLEIKELTKKFSGLTALNNLELIIDKGDLIGLVGPNGSGKSTCVNLITGFLKPTMGHIIFNDASIGGLKPYQIARFGIARTFQLTSLFPDLTARENIICSEYLKTKHSSMGSFLRSIVQSKGYQADELSLNQKAEEILSFLGMADKGEMVAANLPTMDQRKLEIGIALATEPKLLLLDEPGAGMNPAELDSLSQLICLLQQSGITLLLIEHNMKVITDICTRMIVINYGNKIADGHPREVINSPEVIASYIGEEL